MTTNRERLKLLKERLRTLDDELQRQGLVSEYLQLVDRVKRGEASFTPIHEEEWEIMLPQEKEKRLVEYYHTVRLEFLALTQEADKAQESGKLKEWLDKTWVKITMAGIPLAQLTVDLINLIQSFGLFFRDDEKSDYLS